MRVYVEVKDEINQNISGNYGRMVTNLWFSLNFRKNFDDETTV